METHIEEDKMMPMCRDDAGIKEKLNKAKPEGVAAYYGHELKKKNSDNGD